MLIGFALSAIEIPLAPVAVPISVSLSGYVKHPGVYQLSPTNRLSDLLAMEMALDKQDIPATVIQEADKPSPQQLLAPVQPSEEQSTALDFYKLQALRSIKLIRGGLSTTYDLLRFYRLGELEQNPYLQDNGVV
jgi:protein involved in polysaccharide export with SLBB domain